MDNEKKIIIESVDKDFISLLVDGKKQKVPNNPEALKDLLKAQGQTNLQMGEKIYNIGEISEASFTTTIHQQFNESKTSRYLKIFLYAFVPLLAITASVLYIRYRNMHQSGILTVSLKDMTPNKQLPLKSGQVLLYYGSKVDTVTTLSEATFKEIPAAFKGENLKLSFSALGFFSIDTTFIFNEAEISLPIKRDDTYAKITGYIKSENGQALSAVRVMVLDLQTLSDGSGKFELTIPFEKQSTEQRIMAHYDGFQDWVVTSPVIRDVPIDIILSPLQK